MATAHPSEHLSPTCPICDGTGWKQVAVPGKASRMTRCDCRISDRNHLLLKQANIPKRYQHCTLETFDPEFEGSDSSLHTARLAAGRFVEEYPLQKEGLLLWGGVGTGKTHLAVGIMQYLIREKGIPCVFCDYRELIRNILHSYQPTVAATEQDVLRPVLHAEILVLDELGAVGVGQTEWVWDTVSYLLNFRYNQQKTTIITSNYPDRVARQTANAQRRKRLGISRQQEADEETSEPKGDDITLGDRITDRMLSRLHEMCRTVELRGPDYRRGLGSARRRNNNWNSTSGKDV